MFEKNLNIGLLLDFYGVVLSERKRYLLDLYYNEDLSLAEIAENVGISRQGVRDNIKKAEDELLFLEEKLNLSKRFNLIKESTEKIISISENKRIPDELQAQIDLLANIVLGNI